MPGNNKDLHSHNYSPPRRTAHDLAEEAKRRGMWLYDPKYHRWHSPEEFMHSFGNAFSDLTEWFKAVQIRDPQDGISAGHLKIKQLQEKLEIFTKRVLEYFRKK